MEFEAGCGLTTQTYTIVEAGQAKGCVDRREIATP